MRKIGLTRTIDTLGRISLPKAIRDNMKWEISDSLEIYVQGNNEVVLKGCTNRCHICNKSEDEQSLHIYHLKGYNRLMCPDCISAFEDSSNLFRRKMGR